MMLWSEKYDFTHGGQWSEYSIEQQAAIVEAWTLGAMTAAEVYSPEPQQVCDRFATIPLHQRKCPALR